MQDFPQPAQKNFKTAQEFVDICIYI